METISFNDSALISKKELSNFRYFWEILGSLNFRYFWEILGSLNILYILGILAFLTHPWNCTFISYFSVILLVLNVVSLDGTGFTVGLLQLYAALI